MLSLLTIARLADHGHPIGRYLQQTALSYYYAGRMLEHLATPTFLELSKMIYGSPEERLGKLSNVEFADDFISINR